MSDRFQALEGLRARGLDEVLDELHGLKQRQREGLPVRIPTVTLHLRTGRDVVGHVLDVGDGPRGRMVLLHVPGPELRNPQMDAMSLAAASIEAITVHDVERQGTPAETPPAPAPSALQLRRRLAELQRTLGERLGRELHVELSGEPDMDGLRALSALADRLGEVLQKLARDAMGQEVLREQVRRVVLAVSEGPSASLHEGVLTLTTGKAPARWPTAAELEKNLEAVL